METYTERTNREAKEWETEHMALSMKSAAMSRRSAECGPTKIIIRLYGGLCRSTAPNATGPSPHPLDSNQGREPGAFLPARARGAPGGKIVSPSGILRLGCHRNNRQNAPSYSASRVSVVPALASFHCRRPT